MKWREQAITLISKADEDLHILRSHLSDPQVSDEMWGFHAQQAVEKLIKALLAHLEVRYPFVHRLGQLAHLAGDAGVALPSEFEPLMDLTPYAAELRYAMLPRGEAEVPLDRVDLLQLAERFRRYVRSIVGCPEG